MEYNYLGVWDIVKRFLIGWGIGLSGLVLYSCVKHWDFIMASFAKGAWAWFNAAMPIVILILALIYIIRAAFR